MSAGEGVNVAALRNRIVTLETENERLRQLLEKLEKREKPVDDDAEARLRVRQGFGLTARRAHVLLLVARRGSVTIERIQESLYGDRDSLDRPPVEHIRNLISVTRRAVAAHGLAILSVNGDGYAMSPMCRARVLAMADRVPA